MSENLLEVEGLEVLYHTRERTLTALTDVSFSVKPGEIVGIVGESGCGKSTLSAALLGLMAANGEIAGGRIALRGRDLRGLRDSDLAVLRGREIGMIFQDPLTSLNPTFTVGTQLVDAQRAHAGRGGRDRRAMRRRAIEMLERVGIADAPRRIDDYPHQFSGGMRQRIMIAMALLLEPALLIADEATSALDVTLEAQIVELLRGLRDERGTAILFITHDLGVVAQTCDRVIVMYAGRTVEQGDVVSIFERPLHPYTRALLASVPSRHRRGERLATIPGRVPSLSALPSGCRFRERCPYAQASCASSLRDVGLGGRSVLCEIYDPQSGWDPEAAPPEARDLRRLVA